MVPMWMASRLTFGGGCDLQRVIAFDGGSAAQGAEDLVAASDDLVAGGEATEDLDVGASGDAGGDGDEAGAKLAVGVGAEDEDALDELGLGLGRGGGGDGAGCGFAVVVGEGLLNGGIALDQRLDRDAEGV